MCTDQAGNPYIATYWCPTGANIPGANIPQYHVVYHDATGWHTVQASKRTTPFLLGGAGTKRIPLSRPQILCRTIPAPFHTALPDSTRSPALELFLIYRDEERGNHITIAACPNFPTGAWIAQDITTGVYDNWEPTYDIQRWAAKHELDLFVQRVGQGDGETLENLPPQPISVLEWRP